MGISIIEQQLEQGENRLNLSDVPSGIYFLNVSTNGKNEIYRLVKS
ncbi:MAG: T9SS type A sorting domain-containing protein [Bacteroidia bacterium]